jgi:hypothetical protein
MTGSVETTVPIHDSRTQLDSNVHPCHPVQTFGPRGKYPEVLQMDATTLANPLLSHSPRVRTVQTNVQVATPDPDLSGAASLPNANLANTRRARSTPPESRVPGPFTDCRNSANLHTVRPRDSTAPRQNPDDTTARHADKRKKGARHEPRRANPPADGDRAGTLSRPACI